MIKIEHTEKYGRGLYSTQNIKSGQIIMVCEILVLSEIDTPKINETDLKYYTFKFNEKQDCLVLGLGEIFNHDDNENVDYFLSPVMDEKTGLQRQVMVFQSKTDIKSGDQLFINYNADISVRAEEYKKQASLVG